MNAKEQELERIQEARDAWKQSEFILQFLRTQSGQPLPELNNQEILEWYQNRRRT
jgi:hypothetical protein